MQRTAPFLQQQNTMAGGPLRNVSMPVLNSQQQQSFSNLQQQQHLHQQQQLQSSSSSGDFQPISQSQGQGLLPSHLLQPQFQSFPQLNNNNQQQNNPSLQSSVLQQHQLQSQPANKAKRAPPGFSAAPPGFSSLGPVQPLFNGSNQLFKNPGAPTSRSTPQELQFNSGTTGTLHVFLFFFFFFWFGF